MCRIFFFGSTKTVTLAQTMAFSGLLKTLRTWTTSEAFVQNLLANDKARYHRSRGVLCSKNRDIGV